MSIIPSFFTTYAGVKDYDLGVYCEARPAIPSPERAEEVKELPGGKTVTIDSGYYKNIEIPIVYNFHSKNPDNWHNVLRNVKNWLLTNKAAKELVFSDDLNYFYKVVKTPMISETEREIKTKGRFTVTYTCEGYMYLESGKRSLTEYSTLNNPYTEDAHPVYTIYGEGMCILTVNEKTMKANVGQNLTVDTDLMIAYREDSGELINTSVTGLYEDLYLKNGDNTISITDGFSLKIMPRWRTV